MLNKLIHKSLLKTPKNNFSKIPHYVKNIQKFYDDAAKHTDLSQDFINYLRVPHATLKMNIPLLRDDGSYTTIVAYRCHHKQHKLPLKGGTTISPVLNIHKVEINAMLKSLQLALLQISFGGAKGGLRMNPKLYSDKEMERVIRRYTVELQKYKFIGPGRDVPGPEAGSNNTTMDIMKDTYQSFYGMNDINSVALVTGKSGNQGGLNKKDQADGSGVYYILKCLFHKKKFSKCREKYNLKGTISDQEIIIHGFGDMGRKTAQFLYSRGMKIIGIQERDGVVYNKKGLDIPKLFDYFKLNQTTNGYKDHLDDEDVYNRSCDVLVLASKDEAITNENAEDLQCKVLIEEANGSVSFKADQTLNEKGVLIIPDLIGNSAVVISSYVEWLKNIQHKSIGRLTSKYEVKSKRKFLQGLQQRFNDNGINVDFSQIDSQSLRGGAGKDIVLSTIENVISEALDQVFQKCEEENISFRTAAMIIAMKRIEISVKNSGTF